MKNSPKGPEVCWIVIPASTVTGKADVYDEEQIALGVAKDMALEIRAAVVVFKSIINVVPSITVEPIEAPTRQRRTRTRKPEPAPDPLAAVHEVLQAEAGDYAPVPATVENPAYLADEPINEEMPDFLRRQKAGVA